MCVCDQWNWRTWDAAARRGYYNRAKGERPVWLRLENSQRDLSRQNIESVSVKIKFEKKKKAKMQKWTWIGKEISVPLHCSTQKAGERGARVGSACLPASHSTRLNSYKKFTLQDAPIGLSYTVLHNVIIKLSCSEIPWCNLSQCRVWWRCVCVWGWGGGTRHK